MAHQRPRPTEGKLSWSATVMSSPATIVVNVVTVAMTAAAALGVVARATHLSRRRSNSVSRTITGEFGPVATSPAARAPGAGRRPALAAAPPGG